MPRRPREAPREDSPAVLDVLVDAAGYEHGEERVIPGTDKHEGKAQAHAQEGQRPGGTQNSQACHAHSPTHIASHRKKVSQLWWESGTDAAGLIPPSAPLRAEPALALRLRDAHPSAQGAQAHCRPQSTMVFTRPPQWQHEDMLPKVTHSGPTRHVMPWWPWVTQGHRAPLSSAEAGARGNQGPTWPLDAACTGDPRAALAVRVLTSGSI